MNDKSKLFSKLAAVMSEVRTLEKTGENTYDRYTYVTADAISAAIGAQLASNGIAFLPAVVEVSTEEFVTKAGATNYHTTVHMQMVFACTETGETWVSDWYGEGNDRSDKSINKAVVSAVKYFLLKTFLISGGDDVDADAESPERGDRKSQPKPKISNEQLKALHAVGNELYGEDWDDKRPALVQSVTKGEEMSASELTRNEAKKLIDGMNKRLLEQRQAQTNGAAKQAA